MARRKRKTTLFDVINKGNGLTPPRYVATPREHYGPPRERIGFGQLLTDWLARKLQPGSTAPARNAGGRTGASAPAMHSAGDEMAAMRRELAASASVPAQPTRDAFADMRREMLEREPEPPPVAPRRSALDALAALRSELVSSSPPAPEPQAADEVDEVDGEVVASARPHKRSFEALETPGSDGPLPTSASHSPAIATLKAPRKPIGEVLRPRLEKLQRHLGRTGTWSKSQLRGLKHRCNELLDRLTTQNGHKVALGRYTPFIAGGALLFIVLFAFVLGQVFHPRQPTLADVADGTRPDVLNIEGARTAAPRDTNPPARSNEPVVGNIDSRQGPPVLTRRANKPANRPETRGDNYIVVQSYLDETDAIAVVETLARLGIDCTVEKNIARMWQPGLADRFFVVTVDGFSPRGTVEGRPFSGGPGFNPDYKALLAKLMTISETEYKKSLSRKFDPRPYKWEERFTG